MNAHTPKGWHEDATRSECATLREARKRLRTCRELWPENEPAWCPQCRKAQKRLELSSQARISAAFAGV
jgi:hypothetical protein